MKLVALFVRILATIVALAFFAGLASTWVSTFILGYYYVSAGIFAIVVMGVVVPLTAIFLTILALIGIWKK